MQRINRAFVLRVFANFRLALGAQCGDSEITSELLGLDYWPTGGGWRVASHGGGGNPFAERRRSGKEFTEYLDFARTVLLWRVEIRNKFAHAFRKRSFYTAEWYKDFAAYTRETTPEIARDMLCELTREHNERIYALISEYANKLRKLPIDELEKLYEKRLGQYRCEKERSDGTNYWHDTVCQEIAEQAYADMRI